MSKEDVSFKTACFKKNLHNEVSVIPDPISPRVPQLIFYYFTITVSLVLKNFYPIFHTRAGEEGSHAQWNNASDSTKPRPNPTVNICSRNAIVTVTLMAHRPVLEISPIFTARFPTRCISMPHFNLYHTHTYIFAIILQQQRKDTSGLSHSGQTGSKCVLALDRKDPDSLRSLLSLLSCLRVVDVVGRRLR